MKSIVIGCDNAAVGLKQTILAFLTQKGVPVEDLGCAAEEDATLYPAIAQRVCRRLEESGFTKRGILICGTGIGMCMTANKCPGIRAAVCHDSYSAERSILSNNGPELAKKIVGEWITLEFQDGPSTPKVEDILRVERENMRA